MYTKGCESEIIKKVSTTTTVHCRGESGDKLIFESVLPTAANTSRQLSLLILPRMRVRIWKKMKKKLNIRGKKVPPDLLCCFPAPAYTFTSACVSTGGQECVFMGNRHPKQPRHLGTGSADRSSMGIPLGTPPTLGLDWILKSLSRPTAQLTIQFSVHVFGKTSSSSEMYQLNLLPHSTQHCPKCKYPAESQHCVSLLKSNVTLSLISSKYFVIKICCNIQEDMQIT